MAEEKSSPATGPGTRLLTPRRVRELLDAHGLKPARHHGQNFVVDPNTVRKMVRDAGVEPGDLVVEVGPGLGSLTLALRERGADVVAVEIDRGLAAALAGVVDEDVRIVHADAMDVDYADLIAEHADPPRPPDDDRPVRLVANLPYNVATPIVVTALASSCFRTMHVMVQREVGERWCARPGDPRYGGVSVKIAALATATVAARVPRTAFWPVPRVDSVAVALRPHAGSPDPLERRRLFSLVDAGFAQRRKRLRNSLAAGGSTPARVEAALVAAGLDPGARAEELDLAAWRRLLGHLPDHG